ncbi:MAG: NUDIX hydrolase [Thermoanaerobaculia bacterium]|nr:NUDIX hydrolase [Thermoanaerobaculia bacterium]
MRVLGQGRFLRLIERNGWEMVERPGVEAVVAVVACTPDDELVLVEQYREPLAARVIELPAGLVGDDPGQDGESLETAARRELLEETGFYAERFERLTSGPPSAGQSSEIVTLLKADGVVRTHSGGGVGNEAIETHLVPRSSVERWLEVRRRGGRWIDPKIWMALYFLR